MMAMVISTIVMMMVMVMTMMVMVMPMVVVVTHGNRAVGNSTKWAISRIHWTLIGSLVGR